MPSFLVRSPNWIGDQVIARPFFHALRTAHPDAHIAAACVPWVAELQYRDLVDEVVALPARGGTRFGGVARAAARLRAARRWDVGIALPNSFSAAWLLWRAGARERIGYATGWRSLLLNRPRPWPPREKEHRVRTYLGLLPRDLPAGSPPAPAFDPARAWPDIAPFDPPAGPYWVVAPGAAAESRRWMPEAFAHLARVILSETGWPGVVVGGPAERDLGERLHAEPFTRLSSLCGMGPASALWRVFREARFVVSNDSGLAHLASLCGAPVHVVWGGGDPDVTHPLGPGRASIVSHPVPCWPCARNRCAQPRRHHLRCLKGIAPAAVWEDIKAGLA